MDLALVQGIVKSHEGTIEVHSKLGKGSTFIVYLPQPETPKATRLRPSLAWACSPMAVAAVLVAALSSASFRMVGPIYGQEVGLSAGQIGSFLAAFVAGGAIAQYPVGWLADKYDRRCA